MTDEDPNRANPHVVAEFRANAGKVGGYFADVPLLLLTTTGATTGRARSRPVAYLAEGDRYVIVAANAGSVNHPDWYHNLVADPHVTIEVGNQTLPATAHIQTGAERAALIERCVAAQPQLTLYQARTTRQIPVIALEVHL